MKVTIEDPRALNLSALGKSGKDVSASLLESECKKNIMNLSPLSLEHLSQVISPDAFALQSNSAKGVSRE